MSLTTDEVSETWTEQQLLVDIACTLNEVRTLLERLLSVERTGAVSSAEMKFTAKGEPQPVVKSYAGSIVPVEEALDAYEWMINEANRRSMNNWQSTVSDLRADR